MTNRLVYSVIDGALYNDVCFRKTNNPAILYNKEDKQLYAHGEFENVKENYENLCEQGAISADTVTIMNLNELWLNTAIQKCCFLNIITAAEFIEAKRLLALAEKVIETNDVADIDALKTHLAEQESKYGLDLPF